MIYSNGTTKIRFTQEIEYELQGSLKFMELSSSQDTTPGRWNNQDISVQEWIDFTQDGMNMQITVTNTSDKPVMLKSMAYIKIDSWENLHIKSGDWRQYQVYRQGRHKNDIPSVFTLGLQDGNFQDAAGGMLENGNYSKESDHLSVLSDSLTLFHFENETVLLGFLTGKDCFVSCQINPDEKAKPALVCSCDPGIILDPGCSFFGEKLLISSGSNEASMIRSYAIKKRELAGGYKPSKAPSVFCTWYYYGLTVSYEDIYTNLIQLKKRELPFDVYQIDEGWEITLGEWEPNERFPKSMKMIAEEIQEAGFRPGIWTSPFIAHQTASIWSKHPDWKLKNSEGIPFEFHMNDTVYQVFDITNPQVWEYFTELYHKLTYDWGYTYHKLDFTRAAVIFQDADFYDKRITLVQAYYQAVKAIRKGMGTESYFLMCGGLYDPIIGLVDGQRMGADVLSMWESNINRDGKALPFTAKQNMLRYYMNEWWNNDPDALMVRRQNYMIRNLRLSLGLFTDEEVKTAVANQYIGGGLVCSTEPLALIDSDRLDQLRHIMPVIETEVETCRMFNGSRFPSMANVFVKEKGWYNLVLINWNDEEEIDASFVLKANPEFRYMVCEFFSGRYQVNLKAGETLNMGKIRPHGCAVFKIQVYDPQRPYIIGSNAHFSMGGEVEEIKVQNNQLFFSMMHRFQNESCYRILLPQGYVTKDCRSEIDIRVSGIGKKEIQIPIRKGEAVELPEIPDRQFHICDFGAVGDGCTSNTQAFKKAIKAAYEQGGGNVFVPRGIFVTGPIRLLDHVCLHLEKGAVLSFDKNSEEYEVIVSDFEGNTKLRAQSMIYADHAEHIAITGSGIIDGNGHLWRPVKEFKVTERQWEELLKKAPYVVDNKDEGGIWMPTESIMQGHLNGEIKPDEPNAKKRAQAFYDYYRPVLVSFRNCNRILLQGVAFRNSPAWNIHPWFCTDLTIRNIQVENPYYAQNGDALDIESCQRVHVHDCVFRSGDDGICLKSGKNREARQIPGPTKDVYIHDCSVYEGFGGIVLGSEMSRGICQVEVENCTFIGTDIGVNIKSAPGRGGVIEDIFIHDIFMKDIKKQAIQLTMNYVHNVLNLYEPQKSYTAEEDMPIFHRINLERINCTHAACDLLIEEPEGLQGHIYEIYLRDCRIKADKNNCYDQIQKEE